MRKPPSYYGILCENGGLYTWLQTSTKQMEPSEYTHPNFLAKVHARTINSYVSTIKDFKILMLISNSMSISIHISRTFSKLYLPNGLLLLHK